MIDDNGTIKCDNPNCSPRGDRKKLGIYRNNELIIFCPRCSNPNVIEKKAYTSHKVISLKA